MVDYSEDLLPHSTFQCRRLVYYHSEVHIGQDPPEHEFKCTMVPDSTGLMHFSRDAWNHHSTTTWRSTVKARCVTSLDLLGMVRCVPQ